MVQHATGLHHFQRRKRSWLKRPAKIHRMLDRAIYLVIVLGPVLTIPQLVEVWIRQNAAGVSALSFGSYVLLNLFWLAYGVAHRERPIIASACLWALVNGLVAAGAVLYGGG